MKKIWIVVLRSIFSLFYSSKYLCGKYFEEKRMGWYWCFIGLPSRIYGVNRKIPWPVNPHTIVSNAKNIEFHVDDIHIFQTPGCYWQNHRGKIIIGRNCYIAPNVGLITTNHDVYDVTKHVEGKDIVLGDGCWIGMNSILLPGVVLGPNTVVGAGSVVTHSYPDGHCVIAGNPAKLLRQL